MYVIVKSSRNATVGYAGPSCSKAGVVPGREYTSRLEALQDAEKLNAVNKVGFRVVKQQR